MDWIVNLLRKFQAFITNIADRAWKSFTNRFRKEDGKNASVSQVKTIAKIVVGVIVVGILYRMVTNKENFSVFDRYNSELTPHIEVGKTIGNDGASREFKLQVERELQDTDNKQIGTIGAAGNTNGIGSDGLLGLSPQDANKFSCSEVTKKIQRGEGLNVPERGFFRTCIEKSFVDVPNEANAIYNKIASAEAPLESNKAKNAVDAVVNNDDKDRSLLAIANKGVEAPTGSMDQEVSSSILDTIPAMSPEVKDKVISASKIGDHEEIKKVIEETSRKMAQEKTDSLVGSGGSDRNEKTKVDPTDQKEVEKQIGAETELGRKNNVEEAARLNKEKTSIQNELDKNQKELAAYGLSNNKTREINDVFNNIDSNLSESDRNAAMEKAVMSCEAKLLGNPRAKEICSKFAKIARLTKASNILKEQDLMFVRKVGKDPFSYLKYVSKISGGSIAINGIRFVAPKEELAKNEKDTFSEDDTHKKERLEEEKRRLLSKVDPDIYKTRKLLQMRQDFRENSNTISGEVDPQAQPIEMKVSDAVFFVNKDVGGVRFPVNVKVPAVLTDTIYVSDQNLGEKPVHLKLTGDVFNPKDNKILIHKGSILSGRATSLDVETKTLNVSFNKISNGPNSDDVQLTVSIRGEAWDTKGKQITGALLVDYASSVLDKINSNAKDNLASSDQALLDVIQQSNVQAATSAVQKIAQQMATDLQNAKKLFFAPEGSKIIIYP